MWITGGYAFGGEQVDPYLIWVEFTQPNFGGQRPWWVCPACDRRVRILYGSKTWQCRHCLNLTYATRQESRRDAPVRKMRAIRRRLGDTSGIGAPFPERPKGMHLRTYRRFLEHYAILSGQHSTKILDLYSQYFQDGEEGQAEVAHGRESTSALLSFDDFLRENIARTKRRVQELEQQLQVENRLTLGQLAKQAEVPYAFAQEAVGAKLLRPDQGRTSRRKRYRRRLAGWLAKLYRLRTSGMSWPEIQVWCVRRWQPEHEAERTWPGDVVKL